MYPPMGYRPYACYSLAHQPDAKKAVAKTEVWTFRALAPGEVILYSGYLRIDSPNSPVAHAHSVALTINS